MDYKKAIDLFLKHNHWEHFLGQTLDFIEPGVVKYSLYIDEKHLSSPHVAHGGVLSSLMDSTIGGAALAHAFTLGMICSTVEFKINYLSPVNLGETVIAEGKIDYKGKSLIVSSGEIYEKESKRAVAKGMGTFNLYPANKKEFLKEYFE